MQSVKNVQQTRGLNQLLITLAPLLQWPIDTAPGKINWCQIWPGNTQGLRFSQLALCIQWLSR